MFGRTGAPTL